MKKMKRLFGVLFLTLVLVINSTGLALAKPNGNLNSQISENYIPTPEEFLGYKTGETLTRQTQVLEYMRLLGERSDRFLYFKEGESARGTEMGYVLMSTPENLKNWEKYLEINKKLCDPVAYNLTPEEQEAMIDEAPMFYMYDAGMHSSEVGPIEASIPTLYEFATTEDPAILDAMSKVITVIFVQHPDGSDDVVDWWEQTGQKGGMPTYGGWVSHDNNRGAWYQQPIEIAVWWDVWQTFCPPLYYDFHQGRSDEGMYNNTCLLPEETNVNTDYSLFAISNMIIGEMYSEMEGQPYVNAKGDHGTFKNLTFSEITMDYPGYVASMSLLHQRVGAGSVEIGCTSIPELGWGATYAHEVMINLVEKAAKYKTLIMENRNRVINEQIARGNHTGDFADNADYPYAYIVPEASVQKDPVLADKMVNILIKGLVDVYKLDKDLAIGNDTYKAGSYVIPTGQPYGNFAKALLENQDFSKTAGTGTKPYDVVGWTMPLQMGVNCVAIHSPEVLDADMRMVDQANMAVGQLIGDSGKKDSGKSGNLNSGAKDSGKNYVLRNKQNNVVTAVFELLDENVKVLWSDEAFTVDGMSFPKGTIIIPNNDEGLKQTIANLADEQKLTFYTVGDIAAETSEIQFPRVGLYYEWSNTTQEGWNRMVLEDYDIPFERVTKNDVLTGNLNDRFDVIIFSDMSESNIVNGSSNAYYPAEWKGGLGTTGVALLKEFVQNGGYIMTMNASSELIANRFDVGLAVKPKANLGTWYCPGSILAAVANPDMPAAYSFAYDTNCPVFYNKGPLFTVTNPDAVSVVTYADDKLMLSGYTVGEEAVLGTPAAVQIPFGEGQILATGMKPMNRSQAEGNFPMIFNFILSSNTK